jgi:hypothetical protein
VYGKPHKNGIYRLRARGKKFEKFIDFSPLFPISIHVANSRDILVGVVESVVGENHFYENRETNIREIMKLTPGGKLDNISQFHYLPNISFSVFIKVILPNN